MFSLYFKVTTLHSSVCLLIVFKCHTKFTTAQLCKHWRTKQLISIFIPVRRSPQLAQQAVIFSVLLTGMDIVWRTENPPPPCSDAVQGYLSQVYCMSGTHSYWSLVHSPSSVCTVSSLEAQCNSVKTTLRNNLKLDWFSAGLSFWLCPLTMIVFFPISCELTITCQSRLLPNMFSVLQQPTCSVKIYSITEILVL